jgi:hypothetical protein
MCTPVSRMRPTPRSIRATTDTITAATGIRIWRRADPNKLQTPLQEPSPAAAIKPAPAGFFCAYTSVM